MDPFFLFIIIENNQEQYNVENGMSLSFIAFVSFLLCWLGLGQWVSLPVQYELLICNLRMEVVVNTKLVFTSVGILGRRAVPRPEFFGLGGQA